MNSTSQTSQKLNRYRQQSFNYGTAQLFLPTDAPCPTAQLILPADAPCPTAELFYHMMPPCPTAELFLSADANSNISNEIVLLAVGANLCVRPF
ncbi:MAG: hypothetical protein PHX51_00930 [Clostridia bacterium]|nr:hypothetical protein [Clostridia bacterium]